MADVYCIVNKTMQLSDRTQKTNINEPLAYDNALAHAMRVTVVNDDGPEDLSGVGVVGNFKKSNGETVTPINGTVSGNVAEVILPASCYVTPGRFEFTLNLSKSGAESTDGIAEFSTSKAYQEGDKVVYDGKVYVFTQSHSAGAWNGNDAQQSILNYTRTALWVQGHVEKNVNGTIIDPGTPVGNISTAIANANAAATAASEAAETAEALIEDLQDFEVERDPDVVLAYVQTTESSGGD